MANIKSLRYGMSKGPQVDMATAITTTGSLFSFTPNSRDIIALPSLNGTSNVDELGQGIWPTVRYKTNSILEGSLNFRAASQSLAWAAAFAMGNVTQSAAGTGYKYTCKPIANRQMPYFTLISQILPGTADEVLDIINKAVMVNSFQFSLKSGTDQDTCTFQLGLLGSGRFTNNASTGASAATLPSVTPITQLSIADVFALTLAGEDYAATCRLLSLDFTYNNNIKTDQNYRPCGNNTQDGYFVMSRSAAGSPTATLSIVVEAAAGSPEIAAFLASTEEPVDIELRGAAIDGSNKHGIRIQTGRSPINAVKLGEDDETVTLAMDLEIYQPSSGEALQIDVTTDIDGIFGL